MSVSLSPIGGAGWQFFDNNGVPLAGGLIYTYQAGTSTQLATYTSYTGTVANSNPIVLDASGRPPNQIWVLSGYSYKFVLQTSSGTQIWSMDNLSGVLGGEGSVTATAGQTSVTVPFTYVVGANNLKVFVNGSKQIIGSTSPGSYVETSSTSITFNSPGLNAGDVVEFTQ